MGLDDKYGMPYIMHMSKTASTNVPPRPSSPNTTAWTAPLTALHPSSNATPWTRPLGQAAPARPRRCLPPLSQAIRQGRV